MNWGDERYIRAYTRDTLEWQALPWQARAIWFLILRRMDRSGVLEVRPGPARIRMIAMAIGIPEDVVAPGIAGLIEDGCLIESEVGFVAPNYLEAQEAAQSDAQRQRESRARRRDLVAAGLRPDRRAPVIYAVQAEGGGPVKIGFTEDFAARLVNLQTSSPVPLRVIGTRPGNAGDEAELHLRLSAFRIKGEWFQPVPEVLNTFCDVSQIVTCHTESRPVTAGHVVSPLAVPSVPSVPPDPSTGGGVPAKPTPTATTAPPGPPAEQANGQAAPKEKPPAELLRAAWNDAVIGSPLPAWRETPPRRARAIAAAWKWKPDLAWWRAVFVAMAADPWARGENPSAAHPNWKADIDFALRPEQATRFAERATAPGASKRPAATEWA